MSVLKTQLWVAGEETQFNLDVMRENMKSTINQTKRNIEQVRIDRNVADLNTVASMMLFPERLAYAPAPSLPPERIFVEPEKATPSYVPPATGNRMYGRLLSLSGSQQQVPYSCR